MLDLMPKVYSIGVASLNTKFRDVIADGMKTTLRASSIENLQEYFDRICIIFNTDYQSALVLFI